jgi:Protein of unknown function (DUF3043)
VFRRRSTDPADVLDSSPSGPDQAAPETGEAGRPGFTPKKAGPTPRRSQAEASRRAPYQAPTDRKSALQQGKKRDRAERARRTAALQRGEDWALPAKDRGPVRALARDLVDSRRGLSEYYLLAVLPIFVLIFIRKSGVQAIADVLVLAVLLTVTGESILVGRKVQKIAQERFPGQSTRGVRLYAAMRGTQLRRIRIPKPRVNRGDPV